MTIITREQALTGGLKRFYTGQPCKHGHDAERYTLNGGCCNCVNPKFASPHQADSVTRQTRRQAAAHSGQVRYSPGSPCKHGHNCERYVSTDNCVECLNPNRNHQRKADIAAAKAQMLLWGFVLHSQDVEAFTLTLHLYSVARCSALAPNDVISKRRPEGSGIPGFLTYFFYIFPEDRDALKSMEQSFKSLRQPKLAVPCNHSWSTPSGSDTQKLECSHCGLTNEIKKRSDPIRYSIA